MFGCSQGEKHITEFLLVVCLIGFLIDEPMPKVDRKDDRSIFEMVDLASFFWIWTRDFSIMLTTKQIHDQS